MRQYSRSKEIRKSHNNEIKNSLLLDANSLEIMYLN